MGIPLRQKLTVGLYVARQRLRRVDIVEGTCLEGYFKPGVDKDGYSIFEPIPHDVGGNRVPPKN